MKISGHILSDSPRGGRRPNFTLALALRKSEVKAIAIRTRSPARYDINVGSG